MKNTLKVLLLFVDGIGLPETTLSESVYADCDAFCRLFRTHCVPIDASLGVAGLPQSATGQTAIFTGLNAPEHLGQHLAGFPNTALRQLLMKHSLFRQVTQMGLKATFANAYTMPDPELPARKFRSASTVAVMAAGLPLRRIRELRCNQAVYHDLTRETLKGGEDDWPLPPQVSPAEAGEHLVGLSDQFDLTVFEFFLSDVIGHHAEPQQTRAILQRFDLFLNSILVLLRGRSTLLVMVSDHGNVEEPDHHAHTANPVPLCALGPGGDAFLNGAGSIMDVAPRIVQTLSVK